MSNQTSGNNKRIAKNTLFLYFRMMFTMGVSLYTSRVVLNNLGVQDYGIYNVVGGVIAMFSFLNGSMSSATQRFITYAIGKGDQQQLEKVFSTSLQIHALISLVVVILGETIGLWFLYEKLVIPDDRMTAAVWVYQCSILAAIVSIMSVPYNASIVAHEKMSAFAYISILEVSLKLFIVLMLVLSPWDKLITYAVFYFLIQLLIRCIYARYCSKNFPESKYHHVFHYPLLKEMGSFAGWSFWGNLAAILYTDGLNMMLNMFFGPLVNAARGIAVQVQGAVLQFVSNFQMALNPQITKNFAVGNLKQMHMLMFCSARFSYYLLFMLTLPIMLETEWILTLWLKTVPHEAIIFTQLMICITLIYTTANPCIIANQATGKVKKYQAVCGGILLLILPLSYIVLKLGAPAYSVFVVQFVIELFAQLARMIMLRKLIDLSVIQYFTNIYLPILGVTLISVIIPVFVHINIENAFLRFLMVCITTVFSVCAVAYCIGLSKSEKNFVREKVKLKLCKHES